MKVSIKFDVILGLTVLFLVIFGLIMVTSIGVPKSISLSAPGIMYPNCSDPNVDCYLLFKRHLIRLFIGIGAFIIALKIPLKFWKKIAPAFFIITILLLLSVLIFGQNFGTIASRWITIFNTSIQPSEFAKLSMIIYLSYWLSKKQKKITDLKEGFTPFILICLPVLFFIILQNDYGSSLIVFIVFLAMYGLAGGKIKHIGLCFLVTFLLALIVIPNIPHVRQRFEGFLMVNEECLDNYCWQSQQANIAIGSGGFWGKGLTQGVQKSYWLPQASDDFIFAASAEELGFLRIIFIVIAYLIIAIRGYTIANKAENNFSMFLAAGITTWIVIQAFINIGVNTALLPVTGLTLPFISYGGSSLIASLIGVGILLNISENTTHYALNFNRGRHRRSRFSDPVRYRRT